MACIHGRTSDITTDLYNDMNIYLYICVCVWWSSHRTTCVGYILTDNPCVEPFFSPDIWLDVSHTFIGFKLYVIYPVLANLLLPTSCILLSMHVH